MSEKRITYNITETAKRLGVSRNTVTKWINNDKLKASRIGDIVLIKAEAIDAMLEENNVNTVQTEKDTGVAGRIHVGG